MASQLPDPKKFKYGAKLYKRAHGVTHAEALEAMAKHYGFAHYHELQTRWKREGVPT